MDHSIPSIWVAVLASAPATSVHFQFMKSRVPTPIPASPSFSKTKSLHLSLSLSLWSLPETESEKRKKWQQSASTIRPSPWTAQEEPHFLIVPHSLINSSLEAYLNQFSHSVLQLTHQSNAQYLKLQTPPLPISVVIWFPLSFVLGSCIRNCIRFDS